MKKIILLIILIGFWMVPPVTAKMVSYIDENGKIHYVDTNYSKVPERYADQIPAEETVNTDKRVYEELGDGQADIEWQGEEEGYTPPVETTASTKKILFFVSEECMNCIIAENLLIMNKHPFTKFNIDTNPEGRSLYEQLGLTSTPVTVIDDKIIYGIDMPTITAMTTGYSAELPKALKTGLGR